MFSYNAESSPLVRTGTGADDAWRALIHAVRTPSSEGFGAQVEPTSGPRYRGLSPSEIADLNDPVHPAPAIFVADDEALAYLASVVVVVGQEWFRCVIGQVWSVENNLRLMNMDVSTFLEALRGGLFDGY